MKRIRLTPSLLVVLLGCAASPLANAVVINVGLTALGDDSYRYDYSVTNDGTLGGAAIEGFSILFDPSIYDESTLSIVSDSHVAVGWGELILASGVGIPAAYDAFAFGAGIQSGETVAGFAVVFDWLGGGEGPGVQPFEIYDPFTFELLEAGTTTLGGAHAVPEPDPFLLVVTGLLVVWMGVMRRRRHADSSP